MGAKPLHNLFDRGTGPHSLLPLSVSDSEWVSFNTASFELPTHDEPTAEITDSEWKFDGEFSRSVQQQFVYLTSLVVFVTLKFSLTFFFSSISFF